MTATVGPNAILQLRAPLLARGGSSLVDEMLHAAGLSDMPANTAMIDETVVARAHAALPSLIPDPVAVAREAGTATARYIMANRIPPLARALLRGLPGPLATPLLTRAIIRNAWTFSGSGRFTVVAKSPLTLGIANNPLFGPQGCHWHMAVFETLYQTLADSRFSVTETHCCSNGASSCRFEVIKRA
jgi:divinyl protochlorophyllide a 8-vinyl-reductase